MFDHLYQSPLFTDFYQLSMAQVYYRYGLQNTKVKFDYFFKKYPDYGGHKAGYCVFAGVQSFCSWLLNLKFSVNAVNYLEGTKGATGGYLFSHDFLNWLSSEDLCRTLNIQAINEGRIVHYYEPLMVVEANLVTAQLIESSLLNHCNFQTLIATKASRIREAGERRPVIEFGLRRAHGAGAIEATRAALIGGADFSSNAAVSYHLKIPPKGTHAHSIVQLFIALGEGEIGAFKAYADVYPDDCLLLVDTVNTLESGVPNAIKVFEILRKKGHRPLGIRLDSGDLAYLAIRAASMLDKAGFENTVIVLSNDLDELVLMQIIKQIRDEAWGYGVDPQKLINRLVYGVGTRLITSQGHSSLDGVYKLTAVYKDRCWVPTLKISETPEKTVLPGSKSIWRIYGLDGKSTADLICLEGENPCSEDEITIRHPLRYELSRKIRKCMISGIEPLLKCIVKNGEFVHSFPELNEIRNVRDKDLDCLETGVRRMINPHVYHVSISEKLFKLKIDTIGGRGMR
jgi:nicotinate phosphoribosyltransferase